MILNKRAALGGVQLDELHGAIVIRSIDPGVPTEAITAVDRMGGSGQRITGQHWQTLECSVTFAIDMPKREMAARREVFEMVTSWAMRKGWLTVNWLPGKRMWVDKVIVPGSGDLWAWAEEYTIVFRAYGVPFWQNETPTAASSGTAASGSVWLPVMGNVGGVADATFRNMSGMTIDSLWIQAGGNRIALSGLSLGGSSTVSIWHDTSGLMHIDRDGSSIYSKYTGADDLYVNPGGANISFGASRAGILTAMNYGRWV